jgi:hypothetical protein
MTGGAGFERPCSTPRRLKQVKGKDFLLRLAIF